MQKTHRTTLIIFFWCFLFSFQSIAQNKVFPFSEQSIKEKKGLLQKLESSLQQIYEAASDQRDQNKAKLNEFLNSPVYRVEDDLLLVELIAQKDAAKLEREATAIGFQKIATFGKIISGKISINKLEEIIQLSELRYARPVYTPVTNVGSVTSQGDVAMYTDVARTNFNVDGSGFKIGALSDSYNTLAGAAAGIASGDLPGPGNPNGYTTPVTVLKEYGNTGSDEARAMVEHIHDVAPGAQIYARTAFDGEADFAQGILALAAAGCDVIVDDVGYFAEPFFQDGIIAQAIDSVASDGVLYFSSAGNSGRKSYEFAGFTNSGTTIGGKPIHDFNPETSIDYAQQITIPAGTTLSLTLQWDDPFGSLPNSVASANTDLDIRLYNSALSSVLASAASDNLVTGDPYEIMSYTNSSASARVCNIVIIHYAGPAPGRMKYKCWTNSVTINQFDTKSSTLVGHANSTHAIAAGAAAYYNTTAYGSSPATINSFSSAGGCPILFDKVGNPITAVTHQKPELVGPDGCNTTFFGSDISQDTDSYPNFFGTSASAPHLAAGAILLLDAGATTREEVMDAFSTTAEDLDDPSTPGGDTDFDYGTGFGMANVNAAIVYFESLPIELIDFYVLPIERNAARIKWSTATETNNLGFILEHGTDRLNFEPIYTLDGRGFSLETINYQQDVYDLSSGTHYFRLKQQDFDGTINDHGLVSLQIYGKEDRVWYSNSDGNHEIIIESDQNADLVIDVFNSTGQLMSSTNCQAIKGERCRTQLAASEWPSGVYIYQVDQVGQSDKYTSSGKFVL